MIEDEEISGGAEVPREYGNVSNGNGNKLVWLIVVMWASSFVAMAGWVGTVLFSMNAEISALKTQVAILMKAKGL